MSCHLDPLQLLTLDELAALAKQHKSTLYKAIDEDRLHVVHLGRSVRVPLDEAKRYLKVDDTLATVHKLDRKGKS